MNPSVVAALCLSPTVARAPLSGKQAVTAGLAYSPNAQQFSSYANFTYHAPPVVSYSSPR